MPQEYAYHAVISKIMKVFNINVLRNTQIRNLPIARQEIGHPNSQEMGGRNHSIPPMLQV